MNLFADLHTHTMAAGHAYSTLLENINEANKRGIKIIANTEHGPSMPGGPHIFYFGNLSVIPRCINGVTILRGCEANIMNFDGDLDIPYKYLKKLDLVIASLHQPCIKPGNRDENTEALINVMNNPYVDIIGHPGNPAFPIWEEDVIKAAKQKNVLIEINNSSFTTSRVGSRDNCLKIAKLCKKYSVKIAVNTDAHFCTHIGNFEKAVEVIKEAEIGEELVINADPNNIINYLHEKGKAKDIVTN